MLQTIYQDRDMEDGVLFYKSDHWLSKGTHQTTTSYLYRSRMAILYIEPKAKSFPLKNANRSWQRLKKLHRNCHHRSAFGGATRYTEIPKACSSTKALPIIALTFWAIPSRPKENEGCR